MNEGGNAPVFPRSRAAVDSMTAGEIAAFADWYGINGAAIPNNGNLATRRKAVRDFICGE